MKKPTQKAFYEHMSKRLKSTYKNKDGYMTLLEVIDAASKDDNTFMDLVELTLMNKTDRLIYRNALACQGKELTPLQVNEYLAIVEYGLEYIC
jgi:hypothetical protein